MDRRRLPLDGVELAPAPPRAGAVREAVAAARATVEPLAAPPGRRRLAAAALRATPARPVAAGDSDAAGGAGVAVGPLRAGAARRGGAAHGGGAALAAVRLRPRPSLAGGPQNLCDCQTSRRLCQRFLAGGAEVRCCRGMRRVSAGKDRASTAARRWRVGGRASAHQPPPARRPPAAPARPSALPDGRRGSSGTTGMIGGALARATRRTRAAAALRQRLAGDAHGTGGR